MPVRIAHARDVLAAASRNADEHEGIKPSQQNGVGGDDVGGEHRRPLSRRRVDAEAEAEADAEAGEHGVDDVADEAVVEGRVVVEESVVERAVDEVERELDVDIRRELAASIARLRSARAGSRRGATNRAR